MLPKFDPTKIEITNPQFRIVCKTGIRGYNVYFPQRKFLGLFWIPIKTYDVTPKGLPVKVKSWEYMTQAEEAIQELKDRSKPKDKIYYL